MPTPRRWSWSLAGLSLDLGCVKVHRIIVNVFINKIFCSTINRNCPAQQFSKVPVLREMWVNSAPKNWTENHCKLQWVIIFF